MNANEILEQRKKGVYKDFVWECEPHLSLTIKMPNPQEYDKAYKQLRAKNSGMISKVAKNKSKEQLESMSETEALEVIKENGDFFIFVDDLEDMNLKFFENGMNEWKLSNLSFEEFEELKKKVGNFFAPKPKDGGNLPTIPTGEIPLTPSPVVSQNY